MNTPRLNHITRRLSGLIPVLTALVLAACQGAADADLSVARIGASQETVPYVKQLIGNYRAAGLKGIDERLLILPEASLWKALENGDIQAMVMLEDNIPDTQWTSVLGWTALTFAVNPRNTVREISSSDIRDIYQGRISNWKEVGGADEAISRYAYVNGSEIHRVFTRIVLQGGRLAPDVYAAPGAWAMSLAAEDDPYALVHMQCSYDLAGLEGLTVDGYSADYENANNQQYPFRIPVLMTAAEPVDESVLHFASWVQSAEGQAVFRKECAAGAD